MILYYIYISHQSIIVYFPKFIMHPLSKATITTIVSLLITGHPYTSIKAQTGASAGAITKITVLKWLYPLVVTLKSSLLSIFSIPSVQFILAKSRILYKPLKPFPLSIITPSLPKQYAMLSNQLG